jgi:chromodomain-helicase-DNA-binding protein 4
MVEHSTDSEESEVDLVVPGTPSRKDTREPSQPTSVLSHRFRESPQKPADALKQTKESSVSSESSSIAVMVSAPARPWEYAPFQGDTTVESVLEEFEGPNGEVWYKIEFENGKKQDVSWRFPCSCVKVVNVQR